MSSIEQLKNISEEICSIANKLKDLEEQEVRIKAMQSDDKEDQLRVLIGFREGYYSQLDFCYKRLKISYDKCKNQTIGEELCKYESGIAEMT